MWQCLAKNVRKTEERQEKSRTVATDRDSLRGSSLARWTVSVSQETRCKLGAKRRPDRQTHLVAVDAGREQMQCLCCQSTMPVPPTVAPMTKIMSTGDTSTVLYYCLSSFTGLKYDFLFKVWYITHGRHTSPISIWCQLVRVLFSFIMATGVGLA